MKLNYNDLWNIVNEHNIFHAGEVTIELGIHLSESCI